MKNASDAHYWQIDHQVKKIAQVNQAEILTSNQAWKKFSWSRKYFRGKPQEGYFVWVKDQPDCPLFTCVSIVAKNTRQKLENLLVVEENLKIELQGVCSSSAKSLRGSHRASGRIILKKNSTLKYNHLHFWWEDNLVEPDYEFWLEENAKLDYTYKTIQAPKALSIKNKIVCSDGAKASIKILADCKNTQFQTEDIIVLQGKGASGISRLRLIARENSNIKASSRILAKFPSTGHLDCQSLITDNKARVSLVPEVICENKEAQVTHEASIGKVSEEQLNYLRARGLTEKEALDLIISGFLRM